MKYCIDILLRFILFSKNNQSGNTRVEWFLTKFLFCFSLCQPATKKIGVLLLGFLCCQVMNAQSIVTLKNGSETVDIGNYACFFQDSTGRLTIEDVVKPDINSRFKKSNDEIPNFGYLKSPLWVKFTVSNATAEHAYIELERTLIDSLSFFYLQEDGKYRQKVTGSHFPTSTRTIIFPDFVFLLYGSRIAPQTYYMRIATQTSVAVPIKLGTLRAISHAFIRDMILMVLFFGVIAIFLIFNVFNYIIFKDKAYLYFSVYIALLGTNLFYLKGYFIYFYSLQNYVDSLYNRIWYLTDIFIILFALEFLKIKTFLPKMYKFYTGIIGYFILLVILDLAQVSLFEFREWFVNYFEVAIWYSLIIISFIIYRKGNQSALFYTIGWGIFVHFAIFKNISLLNLIPFYVFTPSALQIGSFIEIILFGIGLLYKFLELRNKTELVLKENLLLTKEQNTMLEQKVNERTLELYEKNSEISAQNEELIQQQEQLARQRDMLELQNKELVDFHTIVEEQSREIFLKNQELEDEVKLRTQQLSLANTELVSYNNQLEQFAFATAHNLRSPVARILGLGNVLSLDTITESEKEYIISQLVKSTHQLDSVIGDLNQILEIRKNTNVVFAPVSLHESIEKIKGLLSQEISDTAALIIEDFDNGEIIKSFPPYIDSILYNLVSNSIKYRQKDLIPEIIIKLHRHKNNSISLVVEDNGMGINLKGNETKMFNLYRRFHTHVEGKGIGLYLVKTQVMALGGHIHIESVVNEGTVITISLTENTFSPKKTEEV